MPDTAIRPFRIDVSKADLDDLAERLARTRWANELPLDSSGPQTGLIPPGWEYGVPVSYVRTWSTTGSTSTTGASGRHGSTSTRSSPPPSTGRTSTSCTSALPSRTPSR